MIRHEPEGVPILPEHANQCKAPPGQPRDTITVHSGTVNFLGPKAHFIHVFMYSLTFLYVYPFPCM